MVKNVIKTFSNQLKSRKKVYKFRIQQSPLFDTLLNDLQNFTT